MKKLFFTLLSVSTIALSAQVANETVIESQSTEITQSQEPAVYSTTSKVENSGFLKTVGFEGAWKFELNLDSRKIILQGGSMVNKAEAPSEEIRMMVYLAEKPFDLENPEFIGEVYSFVDLDGLNANDKESGKTYSTLWANEKKPESGKKYYPYILLGEQNPETKEFEVRDIKTFDKFIEIS